MQSYSICTEALEQLAKEALSMVLNFIGSTHVQYIKSTAYTCGCKDTEQANVFKVTFLFVCFLCFILACWHKYTTKDGFILFLFHFILCPRSPILLWRNMSVESHKITSLEMHSKNSVPDWVNLKQLKGWEFLHGVLGEDQNVSKLMAAPAPSVGRQNKEVLSTYSWDMLR